MIVDKLRKNVLPATRAPNLRDNPWVTVALLMLVDAVMSLDRVLPTLLAEPIKLEFGLSDGQVGVLVGLAFAVPLGIACVVLGPLIDRINRARYLVTLVSLWSSLTLLTGLAWNYVSLLCARGGLGAAEGTGQAAALSILGDKFPPERRATAISLYRLGGGIGTLIASALVGYIAVAQGWRSAFYFAAVPGFLIALAMAWLMTEPQRGAMESSMAGREPVAYRVALGFVLRDRVGAPLALGLLLIVFSSSAFSGFAAPFLQRYHHLGLDQVSLFYGIASVLSMASPVIMGVAADRIMRRGPAPLVYFLGFFVLMIGGVAVSVVLAPIAPIALAGYVVFQVLVQALTTPYYAVLISVTPPGMRGTVIALMTVASISLGFGLGPLASGFVSDLIGGPESLRYALLIVVTPGTVASATMFWLAAHFLRGRNRNAALAMEDQAPETT